MKVIRCDVCGCEIKPIKEMYTFSIDYIAQGNNVMKIDLCRDCAKRLYDKIADEAKGAEE